MSTATRSLVGGMFAVATALDAVVVCEAAGAAAVAFSAAAFHRRQRRVIVAATATATAISAPIAPRPDQVHSHRRALTRAYGTGRRTYVTGRSVGTLGTVPRSPLLASSSPAAQQPSMAPPAATVVLALERPTAVPRRRRRPQPRSLGLVVTLGHPLGTPKLQTRPSVAGGLLLRAQLLQRSTDLSGLRCVMSGHRGLKNNGAGWGRLLWSTYRPNAPAPPPLAPRHATFFGSPVDLWGDFDPPAPTPPTRWYWARSRPPTGGGARSEPPPKVRRGSVARAARPRTFLAFSVPKYRRQPI